MAGLVTRKRSDGTTAYKVQWRTGGRGSGWQSETFDVKLAATKFQAQVEAHGNRWPPGWVKGVGFATVHDVLEETPLLDFGKAYVRRLTSVGPDTQSRRRSPPDHPARRMTTASNVLGQDS